MRAKLTLRTVARWALVLVSIAGGLGSMLPACGQSLAQRAPPNEASVANLPAGFADRVVARGLTGVTNMAIAPDGRIFVCEQTGALRVVQDDALLDEPFVKLAVDATGERGLLGVALDPEFESNGFVYVCYVAVEPYPRHVVSRVTADGNRAAPGSETILFEGDDQRTLGGAVPAGHQGGGIAFGHDGKLYVALGEQTAGSSAQRLDTLQGKVLRLNPNGSVPGDNPFADRASGKYRAIWAVGLRNPSSLAVQPSTGRILINDVGGSRWEEINQGRAAANFGWPLSEGPATDARHGRPLFAYGGNPRSIAGGAFYEPWTAQFPDEFLNKYFFADYLRSAIRYLDPDRPEDAHEFASGLAGPVDVEAAPDGSLYYLNRNLDRNIWARGEAMQAGTGTLHKVIYAPRLNGGAPRITRQPQEVTSTIGETAVFRIEAVGDGAMTYQWRRDGEPIPGAASPELSMVASPADHGVRLTCVVSEGPYAVASDTARWWIAPRHAAMEPKSPTASGLNFSIHEGGGTDLQEVAVSEPLRRDVAHGIGVPPGAPAEKFGLTFDGLISIPRSGAYTFHVASSGACRMLVAGQEVVFVSPFAVSRDARETVGLEVGKHELRVVYSHDAGAPRLNVEVEGPRLSRRQLPASWLERINPRVLTTPVFHPEGQQFSGPIFVRLEATTADSIIAYTVDGTEPDDSSPRYKTPFLLRRSATVQARVFRRGGDGATHASSVARKTYIIQGERPFGLSERPFTSAGNVSTRREDLPPRLSRTGIFRSIQDLTPAPGLIPYDVNAPLWCDGAEMRRWIALPGRARIGFRETGAWSFPGGTVLVQHLQLPQANAPPLRVETRLLVVDHTGGGYAATYRWNAEQSDADLLRDAVTETLEIATSEGKQSLVWTYPSPKDCRACHSEHAGFVLGVNTRQLNRDFDYRDPLNSTSTISDNQLRVWRHAEMFNLPPQESAIARLPRLAPLHERSATLEHRVRSYLDVNCSLCHRPGGARGTFDARFETPLSRQGLLDGGLIAADLDVRNAVVVAPGAVERSVLYLRMGRRDDAFTMPPLGSSLPDREALSVVAQWIESLSPTRSSHD